MNGEDFKNWLKLYRQVWQDKDVKQFSELFLSDAKYFLTSFENPKSVRLKIEAAVINAISTQEKTKFGYDIISYTDNVGVSKWWCKFTRTGIQKIIKLDVVFICEFDKNNLCKTFREWWHKDGE